MQLKNGVLTIQKNGDPFVAYCAKTGLVQGKPGKVFAPKSTITRAEMATIMQRIAA